jgi:hypothetical protein
MGHGFSSCILSCALVLAISYPRAARAQACCVGATTISPARLALHEDGLVGLQIRTNAATGSFDAGGGYVPSPASSGEVDLEQDLVGALRVFPQLQLAVLLPLIETWRKVPGQPTSSAKDLRLPQSAVGGGFGDLNLSLRYDAFLPGELGLFPGIALLAGVTIPTGTPPDRTSSPSRLATDSTGLGAVQAAGGVALEDVYLGHLLVNMTALITQRMSRSVDGVSETLGLQVSAALAVGWIFQGGAGLAAIARYESEGDANVNGALDAGSGKRATSFGLVGGVPIASGWRLQGSLIDVLPISGLGRNQTAGVGLTAALLWAWM